MTKSAKFPLTLTLAALFAAVLVLAIGVSIAKAGENLSPAKGLYVLPGADGSQFAIVTTKTGSCGFKLYYYKEITVESPQPDFVKSGRLDEWEELRIAKVPEEDNSATHITCRRGRMFSFQRLGS